MQYIVTRIIIIKYLLLFPLIFINVHCYSKLCTHTYNSSPMKYMIFVLCKYVNVKSKIIDIINENEEIPFNAKAQNSFNVVPCRVVSSVFSSLCKYLSFVVFMFIFLCMSDFGLFVLQNGNYVPHFKIFGCWKLL